MLSNMAWKTFRVRKPTGFYVREPTQGYSLSFPEGEENASVIVLIFVFFAKLLE